MTSLAFYGAAGTVTGSKYLLEANNYKVLVDCGLFQGLKKLRLRNWDDPPFKPSSLDAVILTHGHIDHSGYLPVLIKRGYRGKIYCTTGTRDLCKILLPDSGHLQEEEARYANQRGYSKHHPAKPLYTEEDAEATIPHLAPMDFGQWRTLDNGWSFSFSPAGHIIGSACLSMDIEEGRLVFSGDVGRMNDVVMQPPVGLQKADYLVLESTYGNRRHSPIDPREELQDIILETVKRRGVLVIPAFAVGRSQALLHLIAELKAYQYIPDIPVYLDSPMAINATQVLLQYPNELRLTPGQCQSLGDAATYVRTADESQKLTQRDGPMIIVSASGMASGGRVLHHLKAFAPDRRNTILLVGFQAAGTRGDALSKGAESLKIHGEYVPIGAEVRQMNSLSAHGDYGEILDWLRSLSHPPRQTWLTHGEPAASDALRQRIENNLGWKVAIPDDGEKVTFADPESE